MLRQVLFWCGQQELLKRQCIFTRLRGVTSYKTAIFERLFFFRYLNLKCAKKLDAENQIWDPEPSCPHFLNIVTLCTYTSLAFSRRHESCFRIIYMRHIKPRNYIKSEASCATLNSGHGWGRVKTNITINELERHRAGKQHFDSLETNNQLSRRERIHR